MDIHYKKDTEISKDDLVSLYSDAGWTNYTSDIDKLKRAFEKSHCVVTAWDDGKLVGALRAISDSETIVYIQDILVLKSHQRKGIGGTMMDIVLNEYKNVRQKVLLTDDNERTISFYRSKGFKKSGDIGTLSFVRMDQSKAQK